MERFLHGELELLERAACTVKQALRGGQPSDDVAVKQALAAVDHVYVDFPDTPPLPRTDPGFLSRCLAACRHYEKRIRRILGQI